MKPDRGAPVPLADGSAPVDVGLHLRPVSREDGPEIVGLFNRVFRRDSFAPFSFEEWKWKYQDNPVPMLGLCFLAEDAQGRAVGHLGSLPARLNVLGREERVCTQWLDAMIEPSAQRTGILGRIFSEYMMSQAQAGVAAAISMPNERSIVAHTTRSTMMFYLDKYHLPLGGDAHERLRRRVAAASIDGDLEMDLDHRLDVSCDALWRSVRKAEYLSLVKDHAYLRWKYAVNPRASYRALALVNRTGALRALAICGVSGERAQVLELLSLEKDVPLAQRLVLGLADHFRQAGLHELRFAGKDPWYFAAVFEDFEERPSPFYPFFVDATRQDERRTFENPLSWTVTLGDNDEV